MFKDAGAIENIFPKAMALLHFPALHPLLMMSLLITSAACF